MNYVSIRRAHSTRSDLYLGLERWRIGLSLGERMFRHCAQVVLGVLPSEIEMEIEKVNLSLS